MILSALIQAYQTDPDSPYQTNRYHTRVWRDGKLRQIGERHGETDLTAIRGRTLKAWHKEWACDGAHLPNAGAMIGQLRALFSFGATMLEDPECERLCGALHLMRFKGSKAREVSVTAEQANAIRAKAREMGMPSIALGQALQFEGTLRQRDVIGSRSGGHRPLRYRHLRMGRSSHGSAQIQLLARLYPFTQASGLLSRQDEGRSAKTPAVHQKWNTVGSVLKLRAVGQELPITRCRGSFTTEERTTDATPFFHDPIRHVPDRASFRGRSPRQARLYRSTEPEQDDDKRLPECRARTSSARRALYGRGGGRQTFGIGHALHYKLSSKVRDIQGHNLFLLQQIQLEAQDANRKAQLDIMSRRTSSEDPSAPVKAGTLEAITFDQRMADYVKLPCTLQLEHINAADLDPDLPGTTLNLLWKIRDK